MAYNNMVPETLFDMTTGKVFESLDDYDGTAEEMVSLRGLLIARDFPVETGRFTPLDCSKWKRPRYIQFGRWALGVLGEHPEDRPLLTKAHIVRLHALGLGPGISRVYHRFDKMWKFRQAIGTDPGRGYSVSAKWSLDDFKAFARQLSQELGTRPTEEDYQAAFEEERGPSLPAIQLAFGGVGMLNELIGFPNIHAWDKDDFLVWGVRALRANPTGLTRTKIDALSQQKRGPSTSTIVNNFTSLGHFQREVAALYVQEESARTQLIEHYRRLVKRGAVPDFIATDSDEALLANCPRYLLIRALSPGAGRDRIIELLQHDGDEFLQMLGKAFRKPGKEIECIAVKIGVYQEITTPRPSDAQLHVPNKPRQRVKAATSR